MKVVPTYLKRLSIKMGCMHDFLLQRENADSAMSAKRWQVLPQNYILTTQQSKFHRTSVLIEIQKFLLIKYSPNCGKPLVNSHNFEKKNVSDNFLPVFVVVVVVIAVTFTKEVLFRRFCCSLFFSHLVMSDSL